MQRRRLSPSGSQGSTDVSSEGEVEWGLALPTPPSPLSRFDRIWSSFWFSRLLGESPLELWYCWCCCLSQFTCTRAESKTSQAPTNSHTQAESSILKVSWTVSKAINTLRQKGRSTFAWFFALSRVKFSLKFAPFINHHLEFYDSVCVIHD